MVSFIKRLIPYVIIILIIVCIRWVAINLDATRTFVDTQSYTLAADVPLLSKSFYIQPRPFTIPLFYKLIGIHGEVYEISPIRFEYATLIQAAFSTFCWFWLAAVVSSLTQTRVVKILSFGLINSFGAVLDLVQWDRMLLSESLSFSLFAVFLAGVIVDIEHWRPNNDENCWAGAIYNAMLIVVAVLFSYTRDLNAFLIMFFLSLFALLVIIRKPEDRVTRIIRHGFLLALALVFASQMISASLAKRWFVPYRNVFYARILKQEQATQFYIESGMPLSVYEAEKLGSFPRREFMNYMDSPSGVEINSWLKQQGRSVYLQYLLMHPVESIVQPLREWNHFVLPDSSEYRRQIRPQPRWLELMSESLFPHSLLGVTLLVLLPGFLSIQFFHAKEFRALVSVPVMLLASVYPLMFIVFHADAIELERHAAQISIQIRLSGWLLIIFLMDYWVSHRASRQADRR